MLHRFSKRGVTLLEIIIAMAILAVLAVGVTFAYPRIFGKAYDARRKADLHKIKIGLEEYYDMAEEYPNTLPECEKPLTFGNQIILPATPCDPTTKEPYYYQVNNGEVQMYRLYTLLENGQDISIADVGCSGGCGPECAYNYGVSSANTDLTRCSFVCAPGGGKTGSCELFVDTDKSDCPKLYYGDSTCKNECKMAKNRCKDASGKKHDSF